jgi:hypothetical protein
VPDLPTAGRKFEEAYTLRGQGGARELKLKKIPAVQLWRKMLDAVRDRASVDHLQGRGNCASPQSHVGTVHSSNLHRITLNTSERDRGVQPGSIACSTT